MIKSGENMILTEEARVNMKHDAAIAYGKFLDALGFDWEHDPNMTGTPMRVAKMMVDELAKGCYSDQPRSTTFENVDSYDGMVFQGNIDVKSFCSHHILPFIGKAHVAYIPGADGKIIGLSKLNRIVEYFARRPQVQENLTMQIHQYINTLLPENKGVAVAIEAMHTCVSLRGIQQDSTMKTSRLSGGFKDNPETRAEFYDFIRNLKD